MKKKKITGKLSLQKSKISRLNSSKIVGGATYLQSDCFPECVTHPNYTCNGSQNCGGTNNGGSECKCL